MMRRSAWFVFAAACVVPLAHGATPTPQDFAWGMHLQAEDGKPLVEIVLPEPVYAGVTRADLGDLRVFNADHQIAPHALCKAPRAIPPRVENTPLALFALREGVKPVDALGTRVRVETPAGTKVEVTEPTPGSAPQTSAPPPPPTRVRSWIVDARGIADPLQSLELKWRRTDGASEARVRVSQSRDLEHWSDLATGRLLQTGAANLANPFVRLPEARYDYLRIEADEADSFTLEGVKAVRIVREERLAPRWARLLAVAAPPKEHVPHALYYRADYRAPVDAMRFVLPADNMSLGLMVYSRADDKHFWMLRWAGEVYRVGTDGEAWISPDAHFTVGNDREWRVDVTRGFETLAGRVLNVDTGYTPARLRFLAQGSGPYLLAYGSGRIDEGPPDCDGLLASVGAGDIDRMTGRAQVSPAQALAGAGVLKPVPKPTPTRLIVLWAVLIGGTLVLVGMAFSLLKRLRKPE